MWLRDNQNVDSQLELFSVKAAYAGVTKTAL